MTKKRVPFFPEFKPMERSDWVLFLVFWACSLPFIAPSYHGAPTMNVAAAILVLVLLYSYYTYVIVLGVLYTFLPERRYWLIGLYVIGLMVVFSQVNRWFELLLLTQKAFYLSWDRIMYSLIDMGTECGVLMAMFAGKQFVYTQQQLLRMQKEQREAALLRLQAQVDPHFLFNNLNILDVLIEQNPAEARQYLKRLSALYRSLLRHKDQELVTLEEEWAFLQDYIYLLKIRFGAAFMFETIQEIRDVNRWLLPPGATQTLIENAVKHNYGDDNAPVLVRIEVKPGFLTISNTFRPKKQAPQGTGAGLKNLLARYELLNLPLPQISQTEVFKVVIPLIKLEK